MFEGDCGLGLLFTAAAAVWEEFTFTQLKRYLNEQNMRMVYRVMGLTIPKAVREKLAKGGADFADYFP